MTQISAQLVKELREQTGAGMMDCKKALTECSGDIQQAIDYLRKKGLKSVEKRSGRVAAEGLIYSYIHAGGRIGVMLELNCETDFVARNEEFEALAKDLAMHIAWASPRYVRREEVPAEELEREREVYRGQLKPEQQKVADKILDGKMEKYFEGVCLLEQIDARDSGKQRIGDIITNLSAKLGEKIELRRFLRFEVGEGVEKEEVDYAAEVREAAQV